MSGGPPGMLLQQHPPQYPPSPACGFRCNTLIIGSLDEHVIIILGRFFTKPPSYIQLRIVYRATAAYLSEIL